MHFHVITLFPESFDSYINESIIGRAIKSKKIKINFVNPRMFVTGKYKKVWPDGNVQRIVDDRPYGGGPGMMLRAEPILKSVESIIKKIEKRKTKSKTLIVFLSPSGELFTTDYAKKNCNNFYRYNVHLWTVRGNRQSSDNNFIKTKKQGDSVHTSFYW